MQKKLFIIFFLVLLLFAGCKKNPQLPSNKAQEFDIQALQLIELNKLLHEIEIEEIQEFVAEQEINFRQDSLGSWVGIIKKGNNTTIKKGTSVEIFYSIELLDGKLCYDYSTKPKIVKVGKREVENGFDNILLNLSEGVEAVAVVPSHLAYGLMGDKNKIPSRATLVYRIKNIRIKS